jgi:3',5'-nucleoside bisphosphate phosphatase
MPSPSLISAQTLCATEPMKIATYNPDVIAADLHSHTRASDGACSAEELVAIAVARGVTLFAITDHDTVSSVAAARAAATDADLTFVGGVELSAQYHGVSIHVVGLNIDEAHPALAAEMTHTRELRASRAMAMARDLELSGIPNPYEGAKRFAANSDLISRTHFSRYLVASGICSNNGEVFARFMKPGKPGYVPVEWVALETSIATIHAAGGAAVLAHPARYDVDRIGGVETLIKDFKTAGGDAIEVVCAGHSPAEWAKYAALARKYDLTASIGSDFHSHNESRVKIGDLPRLSSSLTPVWHDWSNIKIH